MRLDLALEVLRIGPDRQPRLRRPRGRPHADARVDRDHAGGVAQQRVDVELGDLGAVSDDAAELHQHVDDAVDVGGRAAAITFSSAAMRVRSICARASAVLSGGNSSDSSLMTSTAVPPWPNKITGPKVGSVVTPAISS